MWKGQPLGITFVRRNLKNPLERCGQLGCTQFWGNGAEFVHSSFMFRSVRSCSTPHYRRSDASCINAVLANIQTCIHVCTVCGPEEERILRPPAPVCANRKWKSKRNDCEIIIIIRTNRTLFCSIRCTDRNMNCCTQSHTLSYTQIQRHIHLPA